MQFGRLQTYCTCNLNRYIKQLNSTTERLDQEDVSIKSLINDINATLSLKVLEVTEIIFFYIRVFFSLSLFFYFFFIFLFPYLFIYYFFFLAFFLFVFFFFSGLCVCFSLFVKLWNLILMFLFQVENVSKLQGPVGPRGFNGSQGPVGPAGPQGFNGTQGPQGVIGPQGSNESQGSPGSDGLQGAAGPSGPPGAGDFSQCEFMTSTDTGSQTAFQGNTLPAATKVILTEPTVSKMKYETL